MPRLRGSWLVGPNGIDSVGPWGSSIKYLDLTGHTVTIPTYTVYA